MSQAFIDDMPCFKSGDYWYTQYQKLKNAIIEHRSQKADDRCIEDDDRLYEAVGDGIKCDRSVGNKEEMLKNCKRFIENRCTGGSWMTYKELEEKHNTLLQALRYNYQHCFKNEQDNFCAEHNLTHEEFMELKIGD